MEDGTGGTEIGVDTTRVVMHIIHRDIAGEIAALQTMHM